MTHSNNLKSLFISISLCASLASATYWQPTPGLSWNYQLQGPIGTATQGFQVWGIDLFDTPVATIDGLKANGAKVICYFSAGSYENWRSDANKFKPSDLGNDLEGWPGEKWLQLNSANVRTIMQSRLDMAVQKHCDGVDPDNVDGYENDNGLGLTTQDSIDYMTFLANATHSRNLALGLKNAKAIIPNVISMMQWSVNEQCAQYTECDAFHPFIDAHKPVFHVEYPKGDSTNNNNNVTSAQLSAACNAPNAGSFSNIVKNIDLDAWYQKCSQDEAASDTNTGYAGRLRPHWVFRRAGAVVQYLRGHCL